LPARYIPRGYISTQQALARLFEARHADLLSHAPGRDAEERRLSSRRAGSGPIDFTKEEEERLRELSAIRGRMHSLRVAAASDIRTALAEGDLSAILLTNNGREVPVNISAWRAREGLDGVWTGQMSVHLPFSIGPTKGQAYVKEADFNAWMRKILGTVAHQLKKSSPAENLEMSEGAETPPIDKNLGYPAARTDRPKPDDSAPKVAKPPVAGADVRVWYIKRRDGWPPHRKHPSQDEDLADARQHFTDHHVTREAIRSIRSRNAPESWTFRGRRKKLAQE
jgi:hypothetical protein